MYEDDVFYMLIMQQICQQREQQVDPYNMVRPSQVREREIYLYPCPITPTTRVLLRNACLVKYYEEGTSLKAYSTLLAHLICRCNVQQQDFHVGPELWYRPTEEDIYFMIFLSKGGEYFAQFDDVLHGVAAESQLSYTQRYVRPHAVRPSYFSGSWWTTTNFFFCYRGGQVPLIISQHHDTFFW